MIVEKRRGCICTPVIFKEAKCCDVSRQCIDPSAGVLCKSGLMEHYRERMNITLAFGIVCFFLDDHAGLG